MGLQHEKRLVCAVAIDCGMLRPKSIDEAEADKMISQFQVELCVIELFMDQGELLQRNSRRLLGASNCRKSVAIAEGH